MKTIIFTAALKIQKFEKGLTDDTHDFCSQALLKNLTARVGASRENDTGSYSF